jgi:hypothetical protein
MLPGSERELRSALLARSATSAPEAYDSERSTARIASAFDLIADLDAPFARYSALSAQLYLHGGPAQRLESAERLRELERFCSQQPKLYSVPPAFFELHRAITAQQDGDLATRDAALLRCERLTRTLGSRELLWHCQRFQALARLDAGHMEDSASQLRALHRRASEDSLVGTRLMCLYDQLVVLGETSVHVRDAMAEALSFEPAATPSMWSIQVRVLATAGLIHEARVALSMVPASSLARLPCDRDYLGTLGVLARAVLLIDAPDYAEALYDLLAPFPDRFAAHVSFHCEGSVAQLLGLLAGSVGRRTEASERLTAGIELCERAGFLRCADEARRELAGFCER